MIDDIFEEQGKAWDSAVRAATVRLPVVAEDDEKKIVGVYERYFIVTMEFKDKARDRRLPVKGYKTMGSVLHCDCGGGVTVFVQLAEVVLLEIKEVVSPPVMFEEEQELAEALAPSTAEEEAFDKEEEMAVMAEQDAGPAEDDDELDEGPLPFTDDEDDEMVAVLGGSHEVLSLAEDGRSLRVLSGDSEFVVDRAEYEAKLGPVAEKFDNDEDIFRLAMNGVLREQKGATEEEIMVRSRESAKRWKRPLPPVAPLKDEPPDQKAGRAGLFGTVEVKEGRPPVRTRGR